MNLLTAVSHLLACSCPCAYHAYRCSFDVLAEANAPAAVKPKNFGPRGKMARTALSGGGRSSSSGSSAKKRKEPAGGAFKTMPV